MIPNKQQRITNLTTIANFIEGNPEEFNQREGHKCIVGLASTLFPFADGKTYTKHFKDISGLSTIVVHYIYFAQWGTIDSQFAARTSSDFNRTPKEAVALLDYLIEQIQLDKM